MTGVQTCALPISDQNGDINGTKVYVGFYASLADAQAKAAADQEQHYSVEKIDAFDQDGIPVSSTIVYIQ